MKLYILSIQYRDQPPTHLSQKYNRGFYKSDGYNGVTLIGTDYHYWDLGLGPYWMKPLKVKRSL